uniref:Ig-like domain-containing protein n=1 Tax=Sphenodon punctatus TaxID=8508 RepID=A0A8D0GDI1_SPHPU
MCLLAAARCWGAGITQTHSMVVAKGQDTHLSCEQTDRNIYMYWYRQPLAKGLQWLYSFHYDKLLEKGNVSDRFAAERPQTPQLHLNISTVEPEDTAVYFCASSTDTAIQTHLLSLQKPPSYLYA